MKCTIIKKIDVTDDVTKRARLLALAGDPTRLRILCLMFAYKEACVSDIAESLGASVANISQHLQTMKDNGYFVTERVGTSICYKLVDDELVQRLHPLICDICDVCEHGDKGAKK